jgi:hypothetical protein
LLGHLPGGGVARGRAGAVSAVTDEARQRRDDELRVLALAARHAIEALEQRLTHPT